MSAIVPSLRRLVGAALLALAVLVLVPAVASAAQPASLRLVGAAPGYKSVRITAVGGATVTASPALFRLRVSPTGAPAVERPGFCVDLFHSITEGRDYDVSMRTAADAPVLASARLAEAAWLIQSAEELIAAAAPSQQALEAGALQVAVWQLVGEARESNPTDDAALNARTAAVRALAAGRAVGGPLAIVPDMPRGCAGRGTVRLDLTGVPGSSATLSASGGAVVSPSEVRFGADGTASATVASATPGSVTVTARATGGTLTRLARARSGQTTPQETMVLMPRSHSASATVTFEDCPVIPLEEDSGQPVDESSTPGTPPTQVPPAAPKDTPAAPFETPSSSPVAPPADAAPPARSVPQRPAQSAPRLLLRKRGPSRIRAGRRAVYTIRVTNAGSVAARGVVVVDLLPDGMSLASVPRGARLREGRVEWRIRALRPRQTRALKVRVRIDADISGRRCNRAVARVAGGATRSARSCTRVLPLPRTLLPAVTA